MTRSAEHPASIPKQVSVKQIKDLSNVSDLTSAFRGQDAVVSMVGGPAIPQQPRIIDAAVAAGVKLFLPSEFGSNTSIPKAATIPMFTGKLATQDYLRPLAEDGKISYALITTGVFLDMGIENQVILGDLNGKETHTIYDGGDQPFSTTTVADVAKAVVGVLKRPDEYKNRAVFVNSAIVTQNQLLAAAKKVGPKGAPFLTESKTSDESYNESSKAMQAGAEISIPIVLGFLRKSVYDPTYGNKFSQDDSKSLGIHLMNEAEVEALVAEIGEKKRKA